MKHIGPIIIGGLAPFVFSTAQAQATTNSTTWVELERIHKFKDKKCSNNSDGYGRACIAYDLDISPDGKTLLAATENQTLLAFDLSGKKPKLLQKIELKKRGFFVDWNDNGSVFIGGGEDGKIHHFEVGLSEPEKVFGTGERSIMFARNLGAGKTVSLNTNGIIKIRAADGTTEKSISLGIKTLDPCADLFGNILAIAPTFSQTAYIVDLSTGVIRQTPSHTEDLSSIRFSTDGQSIIIGDEDSQIAAYDLMSLTKIQSFDMGEDSWGTIKSLAVSPEGLWLAAGTSYAEIAIFNLATGERVQKFETGESSKKHIWDMVFSPDGQTLFSSHMDGTMQIWGRD